MPEIKNYAVRFHGGPKGSGNGIRAQIHCFGTENKMVGWIDFFDPSESLPGDRKTEEHIILSMHTDMLPSVVDILRNEEPIFMYWQDKLQNGFLGTSQEPVGEGE